MNEIWKLQFVCKSGTVSLLGTEEILSAAYQEWVEGKTNGVAPSVITVDGYFDAADRAPCKVAASFEDIESMTMFRMY